MKAAALWESACAGGQGGELGVGAFIAALLW
jgi:hypothetical protein